MTKEDWKKTGKIMLGIACCLGGTVPLAIASIATDVASQALAWSSDRLGEGGAALLKVGTKLIDDNQ